MKEKNTKFRYFISKRGFTLVEIMIAIAIASIIMGAIMLVVRSGLYSSVGIEAKTTAQQDARAALEMMALEIGMASYNPTFASNTIWRNPAGCAANCVSAGADADKGIRNADPNTITVEMDLDANGEICNTPNEIIRYIYDTDDQRITRLTNCGVVAQPFLGDTAASGRPRVVRVINNTENIPVFRYLDSNGNETANIPDIRRIDITLAVESDIIDPMTKQRHRMFYSTSVIPRNHASTP